MVKRGEAGNNGSSKVRKRDKGVENSNSGQNFGAELVSITSTYGLFSCRQPPPIFIKLPTSIGFMIPTMRHLPTVTADNTKLCTSIKSLAFSETFSPVC